MIDKTLARMIDETLLSAAKIFRVKPTNVLEVRMNQAHLVSSAVCIRFPPLTLNPGDFVRDLFTIRRIETFI